MTTERERFEKWAAENDYDLTRHARRPDEYHFVTQDAWIGWQARASQPAPGEPVAVVRPGRYGNRLEWLTEAARFDTPYGTELCTRPADWNAAVEAAAKVCDEQAERDKPHQISGSQSDDYMTGYADGCGDCGHTIRALKDQS